LFAAQFALIFFQFLVYFAFVLLHIAFQRKHLFASIYIACVRLRECVRDAVPFEFALLIESLLAQFTDKRRSIVHALMFVQIASMFV
jgi:hypothetical protein